MTEPFTPTHRVPSGGLPAWREPDPNQTAVATLDPGLDVRRVEQRDDGWAHIVCANDWAAWVDGRQLEPLEASAPGAPFLALAGPDAFDTEVFPLLQKALRDYAALLDDFNNQRIDLETFRRKAFETGHIVRDSEAWILEIPTARWWRYDGVQLTTIEVSEAEAEARG
jgi:hypothetical protein